LGGSAAVAKAVSGRSLAGGPEVGKGSGKDSGTLTKLPTV